MYEAVRNLNEGLPAGTLTFHRDATRVGVWWEVGPAADAAAPAE